MTALDPRQIETLRTLLVERERTVRADIGSREAHRADEPYADMAGSAPDEGDESSADLFADIDHAVIDLHLAELREIKAALARMDDGSYGTCSGCGKPVGDERLLAYPTATRCAHCQAVHEKTFGPQVTRGF